MEKNAASPRNFLKEDLLKVFKDKTECDDKSADLKTEKTVNRQSLFRDVFKFGLLTKKDKREDAKMKAVKAEGTNQFHKKEAQLGFMGKLSTERMSNAIKDRIDPAEESEAVTATLGFSKNSSTDQLTQPDDRDLGLKVSQQKSCFYETQKTQETMFSRRTGHKHTDSNESQEKELETCLQEDHEDKASKMRDQGGERTTGRLTVFTEDTVNVQHEENPSCPAEKEPAIGRPRDFSSSKDRDVKSAAETSLSRLSLLKDHISNVFQFGLSKEKDNKEGASKIKVLKNKGTHKGEVHVMVSEKKEELEQNNNRNKDRLNQPKDSEPEVNVSKEPEATDGPTGMFMNLFKRNQKLVQAEDVQQVRNRLPERKEEQRDFRETPSEQNGDSPGRDQLTQPDDRDLGLKVSQQKSSFCETWPKDENMSTGDLRSTSDLVVEEPREQENNKHRESVICPDEEDFPNEFCQKHEDEMVKRTVSPLTLLKQDFGHFKDDFLNVFRIGGSQEKDQDDSSQNPSAGKRQEVLDFGLSEKNRDTVNTETKGRTDQADSEAPEPTPGTSDDGTVRFSAAEAPAEERESESSEISRFAVTHASNSIHTIRVRLGGDSWSPKNFATYLTFDPNTANSELHLTDGNRKATRVWSDHRPSDHPDRFRHCPQVLCREGLLDSVYWEVEWSGGADVGITYNSISRDGDSLSCLMGQNEQSWSLECSEGSYTPCYNRTRFRSFSPEPFSHRVGLHLDWAAGTLSFYCVCEDTMVHLHTFTSTFTEPLYAGFWIWAYESSVSLCQVELDWEKLQ